MTQLIYPDLSFGQELQVAKGSVADWTVSCLMTDGAIPVFASGDNVAAKVYPGQGGVLAFAPTTIWAPPTGYLTGTAVVSPTAAQTTTLESNGEYILQLWWTSADASRTACVARRRIRVLDSPGAGTTTTLVYCTYADMLALGEWAEGVQDLNADQEGFYSQRLIARNWMDGVVSANFRGSFIGNFGAHSTAAFGFGYVGYSRTIGPSPTILGYLASNFLLVTPPGTTGWSGTQRTQIVRACAHKALSEVGLAQLGKNSTFFQFGCYHRDMAIRELTGIVAELDLNGDGIGEILIALGSTNSLQV